MKKLLCFSFLILCVAVPQARTQSLEKVNGLLSEIKDQYEVDDSGNIYFQKIFELSDIGKEELYERVMSYLGDTYKMTDFLTLNEKQEGRIIGKGFYHNVYRYTGFRTAGAILIGVNHVFRADIKDGRVRITIQPTTYSMRKQGSGNEKSGNGNPEVNKSYPFATNVNVTDNILAGLGLYGTAKKIDSELSTIDKKLNAKGDSLGEYW